MKPESKNYIILGIFLLVALSLVIFFIYPIFNGIRKNSQELFAAKGELTLLNNQIKESEDFGKNYNNYKPNLEKIDKLFVDSKNPIDFIQFLERAASDFGVGIKISLQITPKQKIGSGSWSDIVFQISSVGTFQNFLKFFGKIETNPNLTEIQNLVINRLKETSAENKKSTGDINASFSMKVFIQ